MPCLPEGGPSLSYFFDPKEFDFNYDFDFSQVKDDGKTYMREGFEYKRPYGWKRFRLKVKGKYEDDICMAPMGCAQNKPMENSLFRIMVRILKTQDFGNSFKPGPRAKYGTGIYTSPSLKMVAGKVLRT